MPRTYEIRPLLAYWTTGPRVGLFDVEGQRATGALAAELRPYAEAVRVELARLAAGEPGQASVTRFGATLYAILPPGLAVDSTPPAPAAARAPRPAAPQVHPSGVPIGAVPRRVPAAPKAAPKRPTRMKVAADPMAPADEFWRHLATAGIVARAPLGPEARAAAAKLAAGESEVTISADASAELTRWFATLPDWAAGPIWTRPAWPFTPFGVPAMPRAPVTSYDLVFLRGFAPSLSELELRHLQAALDADDERIIQGSTTTPPPLMCVQDWPIERADALGFAAWQGRQLRTVGEVHEAFCALCFDADTALGESAACRWFLNWWDDTPRAVARLALSALIDQALAEKREAGRADR